MIMKNTYPLSHINDLFYHLSGASQFTKIDLRFGYYKLKIKSLNIHKITFMTHFRHLVFFYVFLFDYCPCNIQRVDEQGVPTLYGFVCDSDH